MIRAIPPIKREPIVITEVTDPEEIRQADELRAAYDRNREWYHSHQREIVDQHKGKYVAVANEKLFVAATTEELFALIDTTFPRATGIYSTYVPRQRRLFIYAIQRTMV
ncbi:MAG: hypothetical protein WD768_08020 [Phycisphaeraceae bacterium]